MRFAFERNADGATLGHLRLAASMDHASSTPREAVELVGDGVPLPTFAIPSLPLRADLGDAHATLRLSLQGDRVVGSLGLTASRVTWPRDSAGARSMNVTQQFVAN